MGEGDPNGAQRLLMDNVIVSPRSASTVDRESETLSDLFCDNVQCWLEQHPLRNQYMPQKSTELQACAVQLGVLAE